MKSPLPLIAAVALATLSACNNKQADQDAANQAAAANAAAAEEEAKVVADMPPPIKTQKVYRCKDASVVYVAFLEGDTQATLREGDKNATPVALKAEAAGKPFTAEGGYSVSGSGSAITVERPGKGSQACKA
jgi:curli biogenesis system outer membrane secretion channel CsgG